VRDGTVLYVKEDAEWHPEAAKEVPAGDVLIVVDDAHRFEFLDKLVALARSLKQHHKVKVLLGTRPSGVSQIDAILSVRFGAAEVTRLLTDISLLQRFHKIGNRLGIIRRKRGHRFLMRRFLSVVAFGEENGDLVRAQARALQRGSNLALAIRTVASGTLRFVGSSAIARQGRLRESEANTQRNCKKHDQKLPAFHRRTPRVLALEVRTSVETFYN
jgi:hypothetical protein